VRATVTIAASAADARAAEVGFAGVLGAEDVRLADGVSLLTVESEHALLSACKPATDGDGMIVRMLNPSAEPDDVTLRFGFDLAGASAVRLDESPVGEDVTRDGRTVAFTVRPHAIRSFRIQALRR
jgi:alpha-mannosidase